MDDILNLSFEQAMGELEAIVKRLEEGRLPLEEAISVFERGNLLKQHCEKKLEDAKLRVEQIQVQPDGQIKTIPIDNSSAA